MSAYIENIGKMILNDIKQAYQIGTYPAILTYNFPRRSGVTKSLSEYANELSEMIPDAVIFLPHKAHSLSRSNHPFYLSENVVTGSEMRMLTDKQRQEVQYVIMDNYRYGEDPVSFMADFRMRFPRAHLIYVTTGGNHYSNEIVRRIEQITKPQSE
jgi:hypothetical protein